MRLLRRVRAEAAFLRAVARHRHTPLKAKVVAGLATLYALNPIDAVPDILPGIGMLDDIIVLVVAITLITRWVPREVLRACRVRDEQVLMPQD